MGNLIDLTGKRFHYLTAIKRDNPRPNTPSTYWICMCDCGHTVSVESYRLRNGRTGSCGCKKGQRVASKIRKHGGYSGDRSSPTMSSWQSMVGRCHNPNYRGFPLYGGRGITVCERWRKFDNFLADMGQRPPGRTIDRIDGSKGYSLDNCRWATPLQQSQNIKTNRHVAVGDKVMTIREASLGYSLPYGVLRYQLYANGSFPLHPEPIVLLPL